MTDLRTAAQQALEALEHTSWRTHKGDRAIIALRAALAQEQAEPVQEPVAWAVYDIKHGGSKTLHWPEQHSPNGDPSQFKAVPLYSAPPQRKPLTDEEMRKLWSQYGYKSALCMRFARAIERVHGIGENDG